jgi:hypothetical protein
VGRINNEKIGLEDPLKMMEKGGGDDLDCRDHRPWKEAGTEEFRRLSKLPK